MRRKKGQTGRRFLVLLLAFALVVSLAPSLGALDGGGFGVQKVYAEADDTEAAAETDSAAEVIAAPAAGETSREVISTVALETSDTYQAKIDAGTALVYGERCGSYAYGFKSIAGQPYTIKRAGSGPWQKKTSSGWVNVGADAKFEEGQYRYYFQLRLEGDNAAAYEFDKNLTVTLDGQSCKIGDIHNLDDTCWATVSASKTITVTKGEDQQALPLKFKGTGGKAVPFSYVNQPIDEIDISKYVEGGTKPYSYKIDAHYDDASNRIEGDDWWVKIKPSTGVIYGTPTEVSGTTMIVIRVTDAAGDHATQQMTVYSTVLPVSQREEITTVTASSIDLAPVAGEPVDAVRFTMPQGSKYRFVSPDRCWKNSTGTKDYEKTTFEEGDYVRYRCQIRVDGATSAILKDGRGGFTVTINGVAWEVQPLSDSDTKYVATATDGGCYATIVSPAFKVQKMPKVKVTVTPAGGGSVTEKGGGFTRLRNGTAEDTAGYIQEYPLKAKPAEGYEFLGWEVDGQSVSGDADFSLKDSDIRKVDPGATINVTAKFRELASAISLTAGTGGKVAIDGESPAATSAKTVKLLEQETALIKAIPDSGYIFSGWERKTDGQWSSYDTRQTCPVPVGYYDYELRAVFTEADTLHKTVTFNANYPGGEVFSLRTESYDGEELIKTGITKPERAGYQFEGWYNDAACTDLYEPDRDPVMEDKIVYAGYKGVTVEPEKVIDLGVAEVGYDPADYAKEIRMTNSGTYNFQVFMFLSFDGSTDDTDNSTWTQFDAADTTIGNNGYRRSSIPSPGESKDVGVLMPKAGLAPGVYESTINMTIRANSWYQESRTVRFTVAKDPRVTVTFDHGMGEDYEGYWTDETGPDGSVSSTFHEVGVMADVKAAVEYPYVLPDCEYTAPQCMAFDKWDKGYAGEEIILEEGTEELHLTAQWKDAHQLVRDEGRKASPDGEGTHPYWFCSECGKMFLDEQGRMEISEPLPVAQPQEMKLKSDSYTYTGAAIKPAVTVTDADGNVIDPVNYSVTYKNNTNAAAANSAAAPTAVVTFKGDRYEGTMLKAFTIKPASLSKAAVTLKTTSFIYNGKARKPAVSKVVDANGRTVAAANYTVSYKNNKAVGKATVTVKGKGNYTGTVTKTFKINPKGTSIKSVTAGSKKFTVKWAKQATQTTGYQIYYSTSATKPKASTAAKVTISKTGTLSKTISKLKGGKKYYVYVRTYKKVNGVKYYSAWSKAKTVTTKK